jgi:hypothetical protein
MSLHLLEEDEKLKDEEEYHVSGIIYQTIEDGPTLDDGAFACAV